MNNNFLSFFQLCDSNFPSGGFSHSYGLETYIQFDKVHDPDTLSQWLELFLREQLVSSDGLAIKIVYDALDENDIDKVWHIDRLLTVQNMSSETRNGVQQMGKSLIKIADEVYDSEMIGLYKEYVNKKEAYAHSAIVFALAGHHLDVPRDTAILYYLYTTIINIVQNAVRAIPIGQTAGQNIISDFHPKLEKAVESVNKLEEDDFGTIAPGIELAQMQHEHVNVRIFMS